MSESRILVADNWNRSVKIVSCKTKDEKEGVVSFLLFPESPFDVTVIPGDQAAVTFPDKNQILFMRTKQDELKEIAPAGVPKGNFALPHRCYGIHFSNQRFYVVLQEETSSSSYVLELNSEGNRLKQINNPLLIRSRYVTTIKDKVYVTSVEGVIRFKDRSTRSKQRSLDSFGDQDVKHVSTLRYAHGVVAVDGDILVCSASRKGVYKTLSLESKFRRPVLSISHPQVVCYCLDSKRLYVTQAREAGPEANNLQIIQM